MSVGLIAGEEIEGAATKSLSNQTVNEQVAANETSGLDVSTSSRRFSLHVAWTFAARILMTVNSVAAGVIVARWLGAEGLGQLAVLNVTVLTVVQISTAGLPSANIFFIAQDRRQLARVAINSLIFALLVGSLLAAGVTLLAWLRPSLFGYISPRLVSVAALAIPFQLLTFLGLNIFLAVGRVDRFNYLDVAGQTFVVINAAFALIILRAGLPALVSLNTAAAVYVSVVIVWLIARYIAASGKDATGARRADAALFKRMLGYGFKFHISTLSGLLIFRADLLVVNHFRGAREAGVYAVASQVAMTLMILPGVIATILFPLVASQPDADGRRIALVTRHAAFVMFFVCLAVVPATFALPVLYGAAFSDAAIQLLILLPGVYLIGLESVTVQHFNATGLTRTIPLFWIATLITNIALTFTLVPSYGARGAALASTITYAMIFALVAFYFRARTGQSFASMFVLRGGELRSLTAAGRRESICEIIVGAVAEHERRAQQGWRAWQADENRFVAARR